MRGSDFLQATRMLGVGPWQALRRDVLPNSVGPSVVLASLQLGDAVLMLASLSFLGLGPRPPAPEWGAMVAAGAAEPLEVVGQHHPRHRDPHGGARVQPAR